MQNRTDVLKHLAETRRQIECAENVMGAQRLVVASLSARGRDPARAEQLLYSFEESQQLRLAEMDRLQNALDKIPLFESKG